MGESARDLLTSFCTDLKSLWTEAGGPSLRALAGPLGLSKSQLGAILTGRIRRPPDWRVVAGLVRSAHDHAVSHERLPRLSIRTGVDEYWRPRYAMLEHAFTRHRLHPTAPPVSAPDHDPGPPLLERAESLASLLRYAAKAGRGRGRVVLLAGEAGVGKSALVDRLRRELSAVRWSRGLCDGLFTPQPLGPLVDVAGQLGPARPGGRATRDREQLAHGLLARLTEPDVLDVTVIEDVHWADEATLDLLRFLARRLSGAAALLIVTYRDDALATDDPLRVILGDLAALPTTRRIGLAPLSLDAVGVLAAGSGLDAAEVHRLTGGNPFYVMAALAVIDNIVGISRTSTPAGDL